MKIFNRTSLPQKIVYNGATYQPNPNLTAGMNIGRKTAREVIEAVQSSGKRAVLVCVLSRNLKGKVDLHGRPYKPTQWIFTT